MFGLLTLQIIFCFTRLFGAREVQQDKKPIMLTQSSSHLNESISWLLFSGSSKVFPHAKQFGVEMHMNRTEQVFL